MLKLEHLIGPGLSVINKFFHSLGFHQAQLETCKSITYDSNPWTEQTPSILDVILTSVHSIFFFSYKPRCKPTKRSFYSFLDNFENEMKSKLMNVAFILEDLSKILC